jgi:segregation and condensation protein B
MASLAEKRIIEPDEDHVGPNHVDSSEANISHLAPSRIGPTQIAPVQAAPSSKADSDPANLSQANRSEANSTEADPTEANPIEADSSEAGPDLEGSTAESSAAVDSTAVDSTIAESAFVETNPVEPNAAEPQARPEELRLLEALLFAAAEPLDQAALAKRMPDGVDVKDALAQLQADYASRGVNLIRVANKWTFRTAGDLSWLMTKEITETRRLSRAAIEVLSIIAYHQPVTRAEIEEIRGVVTSKGTLDVLLETGWIKPRGRRKTPGRPLTFGTTETFLSQFSLEVLGDLPGLEELKGTGLLDSRLPTGFTVPNPSDDPTLREDEEPLEAGDLDLALAPPVEPEGEGQP